MSHYKPYPAYKDSGVEWIGKVPEHWEVRPVYSLATVRNGYPFASELFKHEGVESDRLIRIRDIAGDDEPIFTEETCPASAVISNGDVLIGMDGDFNVHRWMRGPAKLNQRMCAVSGRTEEITQFLSRCLPIPMRIINELAYATTVKHLSSYEVLHTRIAVPSTYELSLINTVLDRETARIDALIAKKTEFIELLEKKRQALITHAVTKGLDPNVKMKDSGVEWIGEVPEHWIVSPFKWQIERNDGGVWGVDPDGTDDTIVLRSTEQTVDGRWRIDDPARRKLSTAEKNAALLAEGDLVVTKSSGSALHIGKTTIVTPEIAAMGCCYSNFMQRIRTRPSFKSMLAWYVMNSDIVRLQFDLLSNSTTGLANLNGTMIGQVLLAIPPVSEQTAIVSFLDRETARIDLLIEKVQLSIDLLKKRRSALITAAVTGQIDLREST
jgi:type I restriction enzyme S subunit